MSMEYIVPSLWITTVTDMVDHDTMEEQFMYLFELEEDRFLARFHQQVQKGHEKAWHDRHIKQCTFNIKDLVFLYDNNLMKFTGKFQMHWLGPYVVKEINDFYTVQLEKINGELFLKKVNGSRLKSYKGDPATIQ